MGHCPDWLKAQWENNVCAEEYNQENLGFHLFKEKTVLSPSWYTGGGMLFPKLDSRKLPQDPTL